MAYTAYRGPSHHLEGQAAHAATDAGRLHSKLTAASPYQQDLAPSHVR